MPRSKATSTADRRPSPAPTFRFVGGKGGVGKTTCAAALALLAARAGRRTLIVSTDPAPSLGDALQQRLGPRPRAVRGVPRLQAVEVDAPSALAAWLEGRRATLEEIALRGTWLDRDDVAQLLRLSLPGIDEIAGLLQLADFADGGRYDHIVIDAAPTGHLLRMLATPAILEGLAHVFDRMQGQHRIMVEALRGGWTPDPADALIHAMDEQARRLGAVLRDSGRCRLSWVTLPEDMAIEETGDALRWLADQALTVDQVIVNRMTPPPRGRCRWCTARRSLERDAFQTLHGRLADTGIGTCAVPTASAEPRGLEAIRALTRHLIKPSFGRRPPAAGRPSTQRLAASVGEAFHAIERTALIPPGTELVLFGGKGGVGKTTCAAAVAIDAALADSGRRVLLLSADPAHSLGDVLGLPISNDPRGLPGGPPNLAIRELDATEGFAALRDRLAGGIEELTARLGVGPGPDAQIARQDRQVLHDLLELAPPGIDELVAIIEVIEALGAGHRQAAFDLIVIDTAPTGHALRLLEMPALVHEWVKAVMAILLKYRPVVGVGELGAVLLRWSQGLGRLRTVLSDAVRTRFIAVTRPAMLPRAETLRLVTRLEAASISVPVVVVNAVGAGSCSRCRTERTRHEGEVLALVRQLRRGRRTIPMVLLAAATVPPPSGGQHLGSFFATWRRLTPPAGR